MLWLKSILDGMRAELGMSRSSAWTTPEGALACMQDRSVCFGYRNIKKDNVQVLDGRSIYVREDREDGAMRGRSPRVAGETNGAVRERGPRAANGAPAAEGTKVSSMPEEWTTRQTDRI